MAWSGPFGIKFPKRNPFANARSSTRFGVNFRRKPTMKKDTARTKKLHPLEKISSGISGLDEITGGGLPKGRPTLVCGNAGCGKTLLAMEFLVRGALEHGDPGVFISFEENEAELTTNVASL